MIEWVIRGSRKNEVRVQVLRATGLPEKLQGSDDLTASELTELRRFPEADRAEGLRALQHVYTRLKANSSELGDLAPAPEYAATLKQVIEESGETIALLRQQLAQHLAVQDRAEDEGNRLLSFVGEEADRRVKHGRLTENAYAPVSEYLALRGAAIARGIAEAKAAKAAAKGNDEPK